MQALSHWFYCLPISAIVLCGALFLCAYALCHAKWGNTLPWRAVSAVCFFVSVALILYATVTRRAETTQDIRFLIPFYSYYTVLAGGEIELLRSNFMNAVLFLPFGLFGADLCRTRWHRAGKVALLTAAACVLSITIELYQYHTSLGLLQADDVLHNTLGAWLGAMIATAPISLTVWRKRMKTTLSTQEKMFLDAVRAALHGETVAWDTAPSPEDWDALFRLAVAHKVLPLCADATAAAGKDDSVVQAYTARAIRQVMAQTVKTERFLQLYTAMWEIGLHPLVVKGAVCRPLYPKSDHRLSGDEDLLCVDPNAFDAGCDFFRDRGFAADRTITPDAHEVGFKDTDGLLFIEWHRALFDPAEGISDDLERLLADAPARAVTYTVEDGKEVRSFAPHDHLLYLILHAYKHFVHCGFGIRQVCDIGLWARTYAAEIDWDTLYTQCNTAHAVRFTQAVFGMAQTYFGIQLTLPSRWTDGMPPCEPMLCDLLVGGIHGAVTESRVHSAAATLSAVEASWNDQKRNGVWLALFPPKDTMKAKFPVLKRHPYLLPVMWVVRLVRYGAESFGNAKEHNAASQSVRIAKERTELLKLYDIL